MRSRLDKLDSSTSRARRLSCSTSRGTCFALANACTHEEVPLAEGEISGYEVTCPWHGVRTGKVLCPPAYDDVAPYNVRVMGTDIEVEV
jgi:3-phenylpropionate/trans-cinnamate dioxygenase ferredoxin component